MNWIDQGRQDHGWFGHGTAGGIAEPEARARVFAIVHFAAERLGGPDKAPFPLDKTTSVLRAMAGKAVAAADATPTEFRERVLGAGFDPVDAWAVQRLMRNVAAADTHGQLLDAALDLAGTITGYGEAGWTRLMAGAGKSYASTQAAPPSTSKPDAPPTVKDAGPAVAPPVEAPSPRPAPYSPQREGFHDYTQGPTTICPASCGCTQAEAADALSRFAVPGQDPGVPVVDYGRYTVYVPGTPIPVGVVETRVSRDGMVIRNVTEPVHIFYDGRVDRTLARAPDGSWQVSTRGIGNNVLPGGGAINQETGPWVFREVDQRMAAYVGRTICIRR